MNAAASELGMIAAANAKAPILAKARQMRAELDLPEHPALEPELLLTSAQRVRPNRQTGVHA